MNVQPYAFKLDFSVAKIGLSYDENEIITNKDTSEELSIRNKNPDAYRLKDGWIEIKRAARKKNLRTQS